MRRADLLNALVFAGYHGDVAAWTRLYLDNRVSMLVATEQWHKGVVALLRGVPCNCSECAAKETT